MHTFIIIYYPIHFIRYHPMKGFFLWTNGYILFFGSKRLISGLCSTLYSGNQSIPIPEKKIPGVVGGAMKDDIEENLPHTHVSRNQGQL